MAETRARASSSRQAWLGPLLVLATAAVLAHIALPLAPIAQNTSNFQKYQQNSAQAVMGYWKYATYSVATIKSPARAPLANMPAQATPGVSPPAEPTSTIAAAAIKVPASVRLQYDVRADVQGLSADALADLIWQHDEHAYSARLELVLPLVGTRTQTSVGRITPDGLAPTRFTDRARHEQTADFEWAPDGRGDGKIVFSAGTPDAPLLAGAQDRLSAFVQLGALLAGAPNQYPAGATIRLQIVGARDAETWLFRVEGMQQLRLPYGTLETVKLTHNPPQPSDSKLEIWLAPSMGYVPVRIRLTQANGDSFDQRLRAREGL